MSGRGAWIEADRQERLDRKAAAKRVLEDRKARRVAAREWVEQQGLMNELGQASSWAIQAALRLSEDRDAGRIVGKLSRQMVVAAANVAKRKADAWVGLPPSSLVFHPELGEQKEAA